MKLNHKSQPNHQILVHDLCGYTKGSLKEIFLQNAKYLETDDKRYGIMPIESVIVAVSAESLFEEVDKSEEVEACKEIMQVCKTDFSVNGSPVEIRTFVLVTKFDRLTGIPLPSRGS